MMKHMIAFAIAGSLAATPVASSVTFVPFEKSSKSRDMANAMILAVALAGTTFFVLRRRDRTI